VPALFRDQPAFSLLRNYLLSSSLGRVISILAFLCIAHTIHCTFHLILRPHTFYLLLLSIYLTPPPLHRLLNLHLLLNPLTLHFLLLSLYLGTPSYLPIPCNSSSILLNIAPPHLPTPPLKLHLHPIPFSFPSAIPFSSSFSTPYLVTPPFSLYYAPCISTSSPDTLHLLVTPLKLTAYTSFTYTLLLSLLLIYLAPWPQIPCFSSLFTFNFHHHAGFLLCHNPITAQTYSLYLLLLLYPSPVSSPSVFPSFPWFTLPPSFCLTSLLLPSLPPGLCSADGYSGYSVTLL